MYQLTHLNFEDADFAFSAAKSFDNAVFYLYY